MTLSTFPDPILIKTLDSSEVLSLGRFQPSTDLNLAYISILFFKLGTIGGSETLSISIHGSTDTSSAIYTSDSLSLSSAETSLGSSGTWMSWLRFDFQKNSLSSQINYTLTLSTSSYTRNADTYYLGLPIDFDFPIYPRAMTVHSDAPYFFRVYQDDIL